MRRTAEYHRAAERSCAFRPVYEGRTYEQVTVKDYTVAEKVGTAVLPHCVDSVGEPEVDATGAETVTAYRVEDFDPRAAVTVGSSPEDAVLVVAEGTDLRGVTPAP